MAGFEGCLDAGDLLGWRGEVAARIQDLLERRCALRDASWRTLAGARALLERVAGAASLAGLKRALGELLTFLKREARAPAADLAAEVRELEALHARIRAHGARESIENYCEYIFAVPVSL